MSNRVVLGMAVLLAPALFTMLHQSLRAQRWGRRIDVAAHALGFATVGIYAMLLIGWPRSSVAGLQSLRFSAAPPDLFRLFLFSLWFGLAVRLLQVSRSDGNMVKSAPDGPRTASPASRSGAAPVSTKSWRFIWGIWWYAVIAAVASLVWADPAGPPRPWGAAAILLTTALALVWSGPAIVRATALESEPTDVRGSRQLADAYAIQRSMRATGYFWLTLVMVTWMSITPIVGLWVVVSSDALRAIIESVAFGIGIGGAIFGLGMAAGRERIRDALRRSIAEDDVADGAARSG